MLKTTTNRPSSSTPSSNTPKRRKDGKLTKAARTKLSILQAAETEFALQGFDRTTLDAVGEKVNVLGTAVLYHFKSKQSLYHATLRFVLEPLEQRLVAAVDTAASFEEKVSAIAKVMIRYSVERPHTLKLVLRESAGGTPESLAIMRPMMTGALQFLFAAVDDDSKDAKDSATPFDPILVTSMLIGTVSFYFSAFPTVMADKLPYDITDSEQNTQAEQTITRFLMLLIQAGRKQA